MNNANDFLNLKAMAILSYEIEEIEKDAQAEEDYAVFKENAIQFCDTIINEAFVELAANRKKLSFSFLAEIGYDRIGHQIVTTLEEGPTYANGESSLRPSEIKFSLYEFNEYLYENEFVVGLEKATYKRYGWGEKPCIKIIVEIEEQVKKRKNWKDLNIKVNHF